MLHFSVSLSLKMVDLQNVENLCNKTAECPEVKSWHLLVTVAYARDLTLIQIFRMDNLLLQVLLAWSLQGMQGRLGSNPGIY